MRKFEGNINGKIYTKESEFVTALAEAELNDTCDMSVTYKYISVPDVENESNTIDNKECDNFVSENQYIKNIINKSELDVDLIEKLKNASNKSDINRNVSNKINDFNDKIEDNLLRINELKSEYKKLDEKIKLINSQIETLDDVNNNYYLQKEYYSNVKKIVDTHVDDIEIKDESCCSCDCKCDNNKAITLKDIYSMTPREFTKYLNKKDINNLADLLDFFIKNY